MASYITGDADTGEFQVVPFLRFVPIALLDARVVPYFEGGIGLLYTDLRGFNLGSEFQFSDNVGGGIVIPVGDGDRHLDVGYRFRHISHAGLWAESNSGLNTHFLLFTVR